MKIPTLIGLVLMVASSSAFAYKVASQKKTNTFGGAPNTTYNIVCNSGAAKTVVSNPGWTSTTYKISGVGGDFSSVDQAAKKACNE
jgi:hypothetical protein